MITIPSYSVEIHRSLRTIILRIIPVTMQLYKILLVSLQSTILLFVLPLVRGVCESEDHLNFDDCNLIDLSQKALTDICNRIGLDMVAHVLPAIVEDDNPDEGEKKVYTHEQYAMGAEECLMVEAEMERLAKEDPEALDRMEREALEDDPDIFAEIISDVLQQDVKLLNEVAAKIKGADDKADIVKDITEGMLGEGEKLEDRPDVLGYLVATIMNDDPSFLDEFDAQLAEGFEDWEEINQEEDSGDIMEDEL